MANITIVPVSINNPVYDHVRKYFKENNMPYEVQEIIHHPGVFCKELYVVIAKHSAYPEFKARCGGGPWVVWSCWNDNTQCLNHGHYDIKDYDRAYNLATELIGGD